MNFKEIASTKRKSIRRGVARFCYLKNVFLSDEEFETLVRRTQDNGYKSAIRFLSEYFDSQGFTSDQKKDMFYKFTIEFNIEVVYCRQFPSAEKVIGNILEGNKNSDDEIFFKTELFPIVKANALQLKIINEFL